jgi:hypothetical protein
MRDYDDYYDPNAELIRRLERNEEKEPRPRTYLPPRQLPARWRSHA